ncbi:hypothetical protein GPJ56_002180 [Histomonas meleagridis]|uniref:uncharacterized protein n=1 Tax=Histomonas meleagridis TaxID=135588 RepID=UPI00355A588C|nr:hypothetical protein GPJ56_002180 [Histomonas meleagridis]KAH0806641.1 hypothetical protein GO595_000492 [Histomonas meleagridis]
MEEKHIETPVIKKTSIDRVRQESLLEMNIPPPQNILFFQQAYIEKIRQFISSIEFEPNETPQQRVEKIDAMKKIEFPTKSFIFSQGFDVLENLIIILLKSTRAQDNDISFQSMQYLEILFPKFPTIFFRTILPHFNSIFIDFIRVSHHAVLENESLKLIGTISRICLNNAQYIYETFFPYAFKSLKNDVKSINRFYSQYCDYSFFAVRSFTMYLSGNQGPPLGPEIVKELLITVAKFIRTAVIPQHEQNEQYIVPELPDALYIFVDIVHTNRPGVLNIVKETQIFTFIAWFLNRSDINLLRAAILLITYSFDNGTRFVDELSIDYSFENFYKFLRHHDVVIRVEAARCMSSICRNKPSMLGIFDMDEVEDVLTGSLFGPNPSFVQIQQFLHLLRNIIDCYPSGKMYHFDVSKFVEYGIDLMQKENDELTDCMLHSLIKMFIHLSGLQQLEFFIPQFMASDGLEVISSLFDSDIEEIRNLSHELFDLVSEVVNGPE